MTDWLLLAIIRFDDPLSRTTTVGEVLWTASFAGAVVLGAIFFGLLWGDRTATYKLPGRYAKLRRSTANHLLWVAGMLVAIAFALLVIGVWAMNTPSNPPPPHLPLTQRAFGAGLRLGLTVVASLVTAIIGTMLHWRTAMSGTTLK